MLPLQGVQVRSLVGELRSHMPCGEPKGKKKETKQKKMPGMQPQLDLGWAPLLVGGWHACEQPSPDPPGVLSLAPQRSHCLLFQFFLSVPPGVTHPVVCSFVALSQIRSCHHV